MAKPFLAHPFQSFSSESDLAESVKELCEKGLDGIEVYHGSATEEQIDKLLHLADKHNLLVSGGSDFHGTDSDVTVAPGRQIPRDHWRKFRSEMIGLQKSEQVDRPKKPRKKLPMINWSGFYLRIVLPAVLSVALFIGLFFFVIMPTIGDSLLERKREMIRELTNSAWSILAEYQVEVDSGAMTLEAAQLEAADRIRFLRYGNEGLDYFWITDMHPRMIMHPYRDDLNGTDLTNFEDPEGIRLFVESVNVVKEREQGYVEYVWQWKDDPDRLEAKESYVRGFKPWGWVIATGIYVEDVTAEINSITGNVVGISVINITLVGLLLWLVIIQSLKSERKRKEFERDLRVSQRKYQSLAEAATEGTLVLSGERCTYANKLFLNMLGYTEEELVFLALQDLLPEDQSSSQQVIEKVLEIWASEKDELQIEGSLLKKNGEFLPVLFTARKTSFAAEQVIIISVADIARHKEMETELDRSQFKYRTLTENINLGVFRISLDSDGSFVEINGAGRKILTGDANQWPQEGLRNYFIIDENFKQLIVKVKKENTVRESIQQMRSDTGKISTISLSLVMIETDQDNSTYCEGILEDVSEQRKIESDRERTLQQMQTSLLFLNEPVSNFMQDISTCGLETSVHKTAKKMSDQMTTAMAITDSNDNVIGLVTDKDLRNRVVTTNLDTQKPVSQIMTAPIVTISEKAMVYEALLMMREKGIRHLLTNNSDDKVSGIVSSNDLFRFDHYSPVVLLKEITDAQENDDLISSRERLTPVISSLVSSGVNSTNICRTVTTVTDAVVEKSIAFAIEKLGTPPANFAFVAMGSEGREEQTLLTDQDNAIIYDAVEEDRAKEVASYFIKLGGAVVSDLVKVGYIRCPENIMASNPEMNKTLPEWEKSFEKWMVKSEAKELLRFNIPL